MQEDELWAPTAEQWLCECEACEKIYKYMGCEIREEELWRPVADEWAEKCRQFDDVLRYRGEDNVSTCLADALAEKLQTKRSRRKREKNARKEKKRTAGNTILKMATQNFNGGLGEGKMEEAVSNMQRRNLGIVFGQEGRRRTKKMERWDTGEIFLPAARDSSNADVSRKKDGNFFLLNAHWGKAFIKGGKRVKVYNPRLMAIWLPLEQNKHWLYLINVHFPDGGKPKAMQDDFWKEFETCVGKAEEGDILIIMGDFNASMGVSTGEYDLVCGEEGNPHQNECGRRLKSYAGMQDLVDLVSWEKQYLPATYYDIRTRAGRQLDRALMRQKDWHAVVTCSNATMIVDSDHEAVVLTLLLNFDKPKQKSVRSTRMQKDVASACEDKDAEGNTKFVTVVADKWNEATGAPSFVETAESTYAALLQSVVSSMEALGNKTHGRRGWWDGDDEALAEAVLLRNQCSRIYARSKSAENLHRYKNARTRCKKAKWSARNKWLLTMAESCNVTLVPSGAAKNSDPNAIWSTVRKLQRGTAKWKQWKYRNIRNADGVEGASPADNATNFADFYSHLFGNDGTNDQSAQWYKAMPRTPTDREWREPQMWEMSKAIKELKNTAPGMTGIPSKVWKTLASNEEMRNAMLVVLRNCWREEKVPLGWLDFYMTVLPKKGDLSMPDNWRGISIRETFAKVYTIILKHRLSALYETFVPEYSNGFRKGRGRSDCIYALLETIRRRKQWGLESWVLLFDCVKMFDRIPRSHVWTSMRVLGVSEKMIRVIQSTLLGATGKLHVDAELRDVLMPNGTGIGTVLGPVLCNLFLLPVLSMWIAKWNHHGTTLYTTTDRVESFTHVFADDTCIIAQDRESAIILGTDFTDFLLDFSIAVHMGSADNTKPKTVVIFVPPRSKDNKFETATWPEDPLAVLELPPSPRDPTRTARFIPILQSALCLGHRINNSLTSHQHMADRMSKTTQLFGALRKNFLGSKNVWIKVKAVVFTSMILPTLLDGVECCVLTRLSMDELTTTYHRMVRSALGISPRVQRARRWTSEMMLRRLGLQPLHYYVDLKVLGFAGHIQRMPAHRLPQLIRDSTLPGKRKRGGQHKTHAKFLRQSLHRKGIPVAEWKTMAGDRSAWRKAVTSVTKLGARITRKCRSRLRNAWTAVPKMLIGKHVEKRFRGKYFVGTVVEVDSDDETHEKLWRVKYDDSDVEDCTGKDLQKILCDDFDEFEKLL